MLAQNKPPCFDIIRRKSFETSKAKSIVYISLNVSTQFIKSKK